MIYIKITINASKHEPRFNEILILEIWLLLMNEDQIARILKTTMQNVTIATTDQQSSLLRIYFEVSDGSEN